MGSMLSGLLGGGSSPGQAEQRAALQRAAADYQQMRPEAMQARLNALSNASTAYQGANNALETLWGSKPKTGPGGFTRAPSPMGMAASQVGLPPQLPRESNRLGEGSGWEDTAVKFLDPLGLLKGFY